MRDIDEEPSREQIRKWRRYLADERMETRVYLRLAARSEGEDKELFLDLAQAEKRHEKYWMELLGEHATPAPRASIHSFIIATLAKVFGSVFILAMAQRAEQRSAYDGEEDATARMAADEHIHGEVIRALAMKSRMSMAGSFRAAVFGANDGLVSNLALVAGVAAAGMSGAMVLITGLSGLLAGALSMGAGEWVSVRSQRELLDASIPDVRANRAVPYLDIGANELALVYRARGESQVEAERHAADVLTMAKKSIGSKDFTRMERTSFNGYGQGKLGAPQEMGTPWGAALSSFLFFATGALIPLFPFIFGMTGRAALALAVAMVGVSLLGTGAIVGILSGKSAITRGLRQLSIGFGAAFITYIVGLIFGTTVT